MRRPSNIRPTPGGSAEELLEVCPELGEVEVAVRLVEGELVEGRLDLLDHAGHPLAIGVPVDLRHRVETVLTVPENRRGSS